MKTAIAVQMGFTGALILSCCGGPETLAQEGWMPVGPPTITNKAIRTVGGITYFTHTSLIQNDHRVTSGPVNRSDTNLTQIINEEEWTGYSIPEHWLIGETHVSVLGALPPGEYQLQLFSGYPFPLPFSWSRFTVPVGDPATLKTWTEASHVNVAVAGIPNVKYIVEASSTCSSWTPVVTNSGGPFTWSEVIKPQEQPRLYRVQIIGE